MPRSTFIAIPQAEQRQMLAVRRRARDGYLLARHIGLLCAAGRRPTTIAAVLFCSRASVYRPVPAYRAGKLSWEHDEQGQLLPPVRTTVRVPRLRRARLALLKAPPRAYGWCRTRWSCATLALTLEAKRGLKVSAETGRRWGHAVDWVWRRANLVAKDHDPPRVDHVARLRWVYERWQLWEPLGCADDLAIPLRPQVGYAWMPKGTHVEGMTPGTTEKHYLAGALDVATGTVHHGVGPRQTNELCRALLQALDAAYPAAPYRRLSVVVDNDRIHKATAVKQWLAQQPRVERLFLPTYCPRANPIERVCGDGHDLCTRNHLRKRLRELVAEVIEHLHIHGPWQDHLSDIYHEPAVTAAVEKLVIAPALPSAG
jgi:putative transposase